MPNRGGPKHHPDTHDRNRAAEALRLRLSGMSFEHIAHRLNYRSPSGPRMACDRLLSRIEHEAVADLRRVEGARLDRLQAAIWDKALAGDLGAVVAVLRIQERRSKLFGLDSPVTVSVGISASEFAAQAAELLEVTGPGPLYELAGLPAPVPPREMAYDPSWSNICADDMPSVTTDFTQGPPDPESEEGEPDEPAEPEEAEVVAADGVEVLVPRSPGQRRIAADRVLDSAGVPIRASLSGRRMGEPRYNPLAGLGHQEILYP